MKSIIQKWIQDCALEPYFNIDKDDWPALITHLVKADFQSNFWSSQYLADSETIRNQLADLPMEVLTRLSSAPFSKPPVKSEFKFIDLFAGIGGFRMALQELGGNCVFSSEWDNAAQTTYCNNYGELPFGDIRRFTGEGVSDADLSQMIPDHDILAAGFPCQPFSRAGVSARNALNKKHGFACDTQGTLFYDIMRIAEIKRPKVLFLENVRNLKSHDKGRTFKVIEESINDLGYSFSHSIINSQSFVPQKRVRCYMVATRGDLPSIDFDESVFDGEPLPLQDILEPESKTSEYIISQKLWAGHQARTKRNIERGTGFTATEADLAKPANTLVARYGKDGKECLIPTSTGVPRKLSKREAARLQGFPESFVLPAAKTPTYKQFGNSVAVPVIRELAKQIVSKLGVTK